MGGEKSLVDSISLPLIRLGDPSDAAAAALQDFDGVIDAAAIEDNVFDFRNCLGCDAVKGAFNELPLVKGGVTMLNLIPVWLLEKALCASRLDV
jgi:hypothetical protein